MIFVKFDGNNKSSAMVNFDPEDDSYIECKDSLMGKRLILEKGKVREFKEDEYAAEAKEVDKKQKAFVIDNMTRELFSQSSRLVEMDFYEALTSDQKTEVKQYRNALRNISKQEKYPEFVEFPAKPTF